MEKKTVLAILSIDGCLSDNRTERSWVLRSDVYGIDEFYDTIGVESLVEADIENAGYVRELLAEGVVERMIVYTVPFLSGGNSHLFSDDMPPLYWTLESSQLYRGGVVCTVYKRSTIGESD